MSLFNFKKRNTNKGTAKLNAQANQDLKNYFAGQAPRLTYSATTQSKATTPKMQGTSYSPGYTSNPTVSTNQPLSGNFLVDGYTNPGIFEGISYQDAFNAADKLYGPYYDEFANYQKQQFDDKVKFDNDQFNNYLETQQANLQTDRNKQDVNAGRNGFAFSEGLRNTQRTKLQDSYNRDINGRRQQLAYGINSAANDLEYQLGSNAIKNMNFNLGTGQADAMSYSPSLIRGNNKVYSTRGYLGQQPQERKNRARTLASGSYGYSLFNQPGYTGNY